MHTILDLGIGIRSVVWTKVLVITQLNNWSISVTDFHAKALTSCNHCKKLV
jgi:hypothetical protein